MAAVRKDDFRSDVLGELDEMRVVVGELLALRRDVASREPMLREKVAAAGFLSQFYNGVENVLIRISKFHDVPLPVGDRWHADLFDRFRFSDRPTELPALFDESLARELARFRGFRHVSRTSYGMELNWSLLEQGISNAEDVFRRFEECVTAYLEQT